MDSHPQVGWWRNVRVSPWQLPEAVCILISAVLPVVMFLGVVARNTGWFMVPWTGEVSQHLFLWLAFLGASVGVKRQLHVRMTAATNGLGPRGKRIIELLNHLAMLALGIMFVVLGTKLTQLTSRQLTPILRVSYMYVYMAVPVGGALFCIYTVGHLRRLLRTTRREE